MKRTTARSSTVWRHALALALLAGLFVAASPTLAMPVPLLINFDGSVGTDDLYAFRLEDANQEEDFGGLGLDIDGVEFQADDTWFYIGLDTMGDFDRDGGPTSDWQETVFDFRQVSDPQSPYLFRLTTDDATEDLILRGVSLLASDWEVAIGTDLEIRIKLDVLTGFDYTDFYFRGLLDNNDDAPDDVVEGQVIGVPEPAALSVVAVGSILVLLKKRRRA